MICTCIGHRLYTGEQAPYSNSTTSLHLICLLDHHSTDKKHVANWRPLKTSRTVLTKHSTEAAHPRASIPPWTVHADACCAGSKRLPVHWAETAIQRVPGVSITLRCSVQNIIGCRTFEIEPVVLLRIPSETEGQFKKRLKTIHKKGTTNLTWRLHEKQPT